MNIRLSHLVLVLGFAMLAVGAGGILATWRIADAEFRDVLEQDLEQQAELLAELLTESPNRMTDEQLRGLLADAFEDDDEETVWVSVYDLTSGRMLSNLEHAMPLESEDDGPLARDFSGYGWHGVQDQEDGVVVQLLRRDDLYAEVREEIIESIVTPALVGSAATIALLSVLIVLVLRPLSRLAREIEQRHAESLAPLATAASTREIRVLRDSINELLGGIEKVVTRERQFANDVAHELRTPLTTLGLELGSPDPDMAAVRAEADRLKRLVDRLLTLARLDQSSWQARFDDVDLSALCAGVIENFREQFRLAGMRIESTLEPVRINGDGTLLAILLRNLIENVLLHCPGGTHARLTLAMEPGAAVMRVIDNGPGMPAELLEQMSDGFTRLDSKNEGFGLGLAICHRIVASHRGALRFAASTGGGLTIEARLPA